MKVLLTTILALALLGCVGGPTPAGGIVNPPAPSGEQAVSPVAVSIGSIGIHRLKNPGVVFFVRKDGRTVPGPVTYRRSAGHRVDIQGDAAVMCG